MYDLLQVESCSCHNNYEPARTAEGRSSGVRLGASNMSVMSRNALHTPLMVLLQRVHTLGNFSKLADWVLRRPRDGLTTPYRLPAL